MSRTRQKRPTLVTLARRVANLQKRVAVLEREQEAAAAIDEQRRAHLEALDEEWDRTWQEFEASSAARHARREAIDAFNRQYLADRLKTVEPQPDAVRERKRQLNEFLAARGMEPEE